MAAILWLVVLAVGAGFIGKLTGMQDNDQASWLPASSESAQVLDVLMADGQGEQLPTVLVVQREGGVTDTDSRYLAGVLRGLAGQDPFTDEATGPVVSEDGQALIGIVEISEFDQLEPAMALVDQARNAQVPEGLTVEVAGPGAITADFATAIEGIDGMLLGVAGAVVIAILIVVYRSPFLPLVVLISVGGALALSSTIVYRLVDAGTVSLDAQSQGIMFILVFGAATDYALLLVARYREELQRCAAPREAIVRAWKSTWEPIMASGGTVILGLLCMLLSDLQTNRNLGPVAAIGVATSILAALTFLPALLLLTGRLGFWPRVPALIEGTAQSGVVLAAAPAAAGQAEAEAEHGAETGRVAAVPADTGLDPAAAGSSRDAMAREHPRWWRLAGSIGRHPRRYLAGSILVLVAMAVFAPQFKASGTAQTDVFLDRVDSVAGQDLISAHFDAGLAAPAVILTDADHVAEVRAAAAVDGAGPAVPVARHGEVVELNAVLTDAPDSKEAIATVAAMREAVRAVDGADAQVGGMSAIQLDVEDTSTRDRTVIIPAVLLVVTLVLMLLLRAIVAPLLLIATVVVSFASALGVSALVFNQVLGFPGSDPAMPLFAFVFLVALGIDYNIFLMTRAREESGWFGTRTGTLRALAVTGGVITSAGVVLAATFASLSVIPLLFLAQIAFIVAFGVLLDTLLVRTLLVPALVRLIGDKVWWPSRLARGPDPYRRGR